MKYTITLFFAMIGLLISAQTQISVTTNGQAVNVYIDGNLQTQMPKTYLMVINVPQGQHEVRVQAQGFNQVYSSQNMYFLNSKRYNFNVHNINGINQLVLSSMNNATMMTANGSNVVNYSSNIVTHHTGTLNPNCVCGNCYGNVLNCTNTNPGGGSIHIDFNGGTITSGTNNACSCASNPNTGIWYCAVHHPNAPHYTGGGTTVINHNQHGPHPQMTSYNGHVGCYMNRISRSDFVNAIKQESFGDDKLRVAKSALKHNAISVDDLIAGLNEFSFDDKKLELAKYAYDHLIDVNNAYKVGNAFTFSSAKDDYHQFVESK